MEFVKCKNEIEKIQAIAKYCQTQINDNNYRIDWLKANQDSPLDYAEEIHELKTRKAHFEKIIEIIEADEFTSVMIF